MDNLKILIFMEGVEEKYKNAKPNGPKIVLSDLRVPGRSGRIYILRVKF